MTSSKYLKLISYIKDTGGEWQTCKTLLDFTWFKRNNYFNKQRI